ncbi:hypothetical protein [Paraflavitalea pollutisoli]|uniref:hypothetical protein n=1 Tax=Paraflavitalea pollutisoli TaxID=3034143 RepID=UPI0023EE0218|nr:hypothetical protein [Paraflavitalea sp. H1-2-19X]
MTILIAIISCFALHLLMLMIYSFSMFSCFSGFFMLYNTSRKAKLSTTGRFEQWLQTHPPVAKAAGLALIVVSFVVLAVSLGIGVGILTALLLLMAAASLIVMIAPLQYLKLKHIALLAAGTILLETLFA